MSTYSDEAIEAIKMMASDGVVPNLRGADLSEANLSEADLRRADLSEADLSEADLRGADLRWAVGYIVGPERSDGHRIDLRAIDGSWRVVAGCLTRRNMTLAEYRARAEAYDDDDKRAETLAICDYLDARAPRVKMEA